MNEEIAEQERAALAVLRSTGVDVLEAALVAKEALAAGRGRLKRARQCLQLGQEQLRLQEKTVTFRKAALAARKGRRPRTIIDFRYLCKRLMDQNKGLAERRVRSITAAECTRYLKQAFPNSAAQYKKARAALSGVFTCAVREGWCEANPIAKVSVPTITEKPIAPLNAKEIARLEQTAEREEFRDMKLSLHLLIYCGIRPTEVSRLRPQDIDISEGQVLVRPTTSKTGGGRMVPLRCHQRLRDAPLVIPRNWQQRWRELRRAAGFTRWVPDVCRHSFAAYHAAHFRNLQELQWEMGHRDSTLLRTRYVSPVSRQAAAVFWGERIKRTCFGAGPAPKHVRKKGSEQVAYLEEGLLRGRRPRG